MIEEDEKIIVKNNNGVHVLGSGFNSPDEIKDEIKRRFRNPHGEYVYGSINELGSFDIEKKYPKTKEYTSKDEDKFKNIGINAENDDRIISFTEIRKIRKYSTNASIYRQNIRYSNGEVDFSLKIQNDLFDEVPVSTLDEEIEDKIVNIFEDVVNENAIYMGYSSGYAKRGRRNPYIRVYGRLKRDSDKDRELRQLYSLDFIKGMYWSLDNITPIPIYTRYTNEKEERKDEVDVIAITNCIDSEDDSYEEISEYILEKVKEYSNNIENNYNLHVTEIGKTAYNKEFMTIYLGIKFKK